MPKTKKLLLELASGKDDFKNNQTLCLNLRTEIADMCTSNKCFSAGLLIRRLKNSYTILEREEENPIELAAIANSVKEAFGYDSVTISYKKNSKTGGIDYTITYIPKESKPKLKSLEVKK